MSSSIDNLSSQYNDLLTQYTNIYQNYLSIIQQQENKNFTFVPDTSYSSNNTINILNNSSLDLCESACLSDNNCTGATFNNNANSCILYSGNGDIIKTPQSTAIVQQALYYSYQLQQINSQLISLNQQMMQISNSSYNQFQETQQMNQEKGIILNKNFHTLEQERRKINLMIKEYQTLNEAQEDGSLIVTSNYYYYLILVLVVIFLVGVFMKVSLATSRYDNDGGNWIFFIGIIVIIIFLLYLLRNK